MLLTIAVRCATTLAMHVTARRARRALLMALAAMVGACGGDPLVGTWTTTTFPGGTMPADVTSYRESLAFRSDGSMSVTIAFSFASTASARAGCTQTCALDGLTWTDVAHDSAITLTVGGNATTTSSRSGCAHASDDQATAPATSNDCPSGMPSGTYACSVQGNVLSSLDASGATTMFARGM